MLRVHAAVNNLQAVFTPYNRCDSKEVHSESVSLQHNVARLADVLLKRAKVQIREESLAKQRSLALTLALLGTVANSAEIYLDVEQLCGSVKAGKLLHQRPLLL